MTSFSFCEAYMIREADKNNILEVNEKKIEWKDILWVIVNILFSNKNFVSALEVSDLQNGGWTCVDAKDGTKCQQYIASECASKCNSTCIPTASINASECRLGTCFNPTNGECNIRTPKLICERTGSAWYSDPSGNIAQCKRGCCQINGEFSFINEQECSYQSSLLGITKNFRSDLKTELACYSQRNLNLEGACVYGAVNDEGKRGCKFTTQQDCRTNIKGVFYRDKLCSNAALNTACERMKTTGCLSSKDEVYWFDSCGNRENIWSAGIGSWNNGSVLKKADSCSIGNPSNPLLNANTCGNCNYFTGSICGNAGGIGGTASKCIDLNCVDKNRNARLNGESWCEYQGSVGLDESMGGGRASRSTDSVGSRDFRKTCIRGEIINEPCADYRNEICVESKVDISGGKKMSFAACKLNTWQMCLEMNSEPGKKATCEKNSDCFLKQVSVGDFRFNVCTSKYAPGFLFEEGGRGDGAEAVCGVGTQTCTKTEIKKLSGWKCVGGCECTSSKFTQEMNNFCISLGDCGAKANYLGDLSEGYSISNAPRLSSSYLSSVQRYAYEEFFKDKFIQATSIPSMILGIPSASFGGGEYPRFEGASFLTTTAIGGVGFIASYAATHGVGLGLGFISTAAPAGFIGPTAAPMLSALGGALSGAGIGLSIVSMLLSFTGVGAGLEPWMAYTLMALGAAGGALIGATVLSGGLGGIKAGLAACATGVGCIVGIVIIVVVVIIIIIFKILGIGKKRETKVTFTCEPWQAKNGGGDCGKCGGDGFPCSAYACSSLGQTCQIINEDSDSPECIDVAKGDISAPVLSPWTELISRGHNYSSVKGNGFSLVGPSAGCLNPGTQVNFGLLLNEHGKCRYSLEHTNKFEDMINDLGTSRLFRKNHTIIYTVPTLGDLGYDEKTDSGNATMFVRCQDKNGNANIEEYAIDFCIKKSVDLSAPVIVYKSPGIEYLKYGENEQNVSIYTDEYAECKWDYSDKEYETMDNEMSCVANSQLANSNGLCTTTFKIANSGNDSFYVRCKDHPEIGNSSVVEFNLGGNKTLKYDSEEINYNEIIRLNGGSMDNVTNVTINESVISNVVVGGINLTQMRNDNHESSRFYLRETVNPLIIESAYPNGENIEAGVEPTTIRMRVTTLNGVDEGNALCYYFFENSSRIPFEETGSALHLQDFSQVYSGDINIPVECEDVAGNIAKMDVNFKVLLDSDAPRVVRVYSSGSSVNLITDEDARCVYSTSNCDYEITNGTVIPGTDSRVHSFPYEMGNTYYIKCKDRYNWNPGSLCSVVVKPSRIGGA